MASLKNKPKETSLLAVRLAALLRESRLILLGAAAIYLILVLYGYDRNDPAWSHSASNVVPHNAGGIVGAWSADILLYVFGFSAWWWAVLLSQKVWIGYRGIAQNSLFDRRALWIALLGFVLLLVASSSLEA